MTNDLREELEDCAYNMDHHSSQIQNTLEGMKEPFFVFHKSYLAYIDEQQALYSLNKKRHDEILAMLNEKIQE